MQESLPAAVPANFGEDESFLKARTLTLTP